MVSYYRTRKSNKVSTRNKNQHRRRRRLSRRKRREGGFTMKSPFRSSRPSFIKQIHSNNNNVMHKVDTLSPLNMQMIYFDRSYHVQDNYFANNQLLQLLLQTALRCFNRSTLTFYHLRPDASTKEQSFYLKEGAGNIVKFVHEGRTNTLYCKENLIENTVIRPIQFEVFRFTFMKEMINKQMKMAIVFVNDHHANDFSYIFKVMETSKEKAILLNSMEIINKLPKRFLGYTKEGKPKHLRLAKHISRQFDKKIAQPVTKLLAPLRNTAAWNKNRKPEEEQLPPQPLPQEESTFYNNPMRAANSAR